MEWQPYKRAFTLAQESWSRKWKRDMNGTPSRSSSPSSAAVATLAVCMFLNRLATSASTYGVRLLNHLARAFYLVVHSSFPGKRCHNNNVSRGTCCLGVRRIITEGAEPKRYTVCVTNACYI